MPIIWLDTCVLSDLVELGELVGQGSPEERARASRIERALMDCARAGKVVCPRAEQQFEYELASRVPGLADKIDEKLDQLSLGVLMRPSQAIEMNQVLRAMVSYIEGSEEVLLPNSVFFFEDPGSVVQRARAMGMHVTTHFKSTADELANRQLSKVNTLNYTERLKGELLLSYEEQLAQERTGMLDAFDMTLARFSRQPPTSSREWNQLQAWRPYELAWVLHGGQPPWPEGFRQFLTSPYVEGLPVNQVRAPLWADLLTGSKSIRISDSMDVDQLAAAIPCSHLVMTDRAQAARIKRRSLDKRYATEVYSLNTADEFLKALERIAGG